MTNNNVERPVKDAFNRLLDVAKVPMGNGDAVVAILEALHRAGIREGMERNYKND